MSRAHRVDACVLLPPPRGRVACANGARGANSACAIDSRWRTRSRELAHSRTIFAPTQPEEEIRVLSHELAELNNVTSAHVAAYNNVGVSNNVGVNGGRALRQLGARPQHVPLTVAAPHARSLRHSAIPRTLCLPRSRLARSSPRTTITTTTRSSGAPRRKH